MSNQDYRRIIRDAVEYAKIAYLCQNDPQGVQEALANKARSHSGHSYNVTILTDSLSGNGEVRELVRLANIYNNRYTRAMNHISRKHSKRIPGKLVAISFGEQYVSVYRNPESPRYLVQFETAYEMTDEITLQTDSDSTDYDNEISEEALFQLSLTYTPAEMEVYIYGWVFKHYNLRPFTVILDNEYQFEYDDISSALLLAYKDYNGYPKVQTF